VKARKENIRNMVLFKNLLCVNVFNLS